MKFKVKREAILKPLQAVSGVVERRQTLPVLSNILLVASPEGITMTATDLEVELKAQARLPVDEPGETTIPARKFMDICRNLPEGADIGFATKDGRALLKSGRSRFSLSTLPATEFPAVETSQFQHDFSLTQTALRHLIEQTGFAMAQQDVRYYLNGLMLEMTPERLRGVATDGHRLALCDEGVSTSVSEQAQIIVPRKGVMELMRLLEDSDSLARVQVSANHIKVTTPELTVTSKLIDGKFPDYDRVIPEPDSTPMVANREVLRQALQRTAILSNEKYRGVRLHMHENILKILAHNPEQEEAEDEIEVQYDGPELEIGFNVNYLIDAISATEGENVSLAVTNANSSALITASGRSDCLYVVMPMRL